MLGQEAIAEHSRFHASHSLPSHRKLHERSRIRSRARHARILHTAVTLDQRVCSLKKKRQNAALASQRETRFGSDSAKTLTAKKPVRIAALGLLDDRLLTARGSLFATVAVAIISLISFASTLSLEWIWDDDQYVYSNPHLRSLSGLYAIWFEPNATPQYYPVVFSLLWLLYQLAGNTPWVFHATNVALHACNSALCYRILRQLNLKSALWIAVAFAIHPIQVESVAWSTELKNILSGFFYASCWLTLWPALVQIQQASDSPEHQEFVKDRDADSPPVQDLSPHELGRAPNMFSDRSMTWRLLFAIGLFFCALLSKSVTASLPAAMMVAIWFRRGRIQLRQLVVLAAMLIVGGLMGWNTARLERLHVGAVGADWDYSLLDRVGIAARCLVHYAEQTVLPLQQIFFYPRFDPNFGPPATVAVVLCAAALIAAGYMAFAQRRRGPLAAILFFVGSAFPALGFLNVYPHRFSFVADHFVYIPILGLLCIFWSTILAVSRKLHTQANVKPFVALLPAIGLLGFYAFQSQRYIPSFENEFALWEDTLEKNPDCPAAMQNLALQLFATGDNAAALHWLDKAMQYDFDRFQTLNSRGMVLGSLGQTQEAIEAFRKSLELNPANHTAWANLGNLSRFLLSQPDAEPFELTPEQCYQRSWDAKPNYLAAFALGTLKYEESNKSLAAEWFAAAAEIRPWDIDAPFNQAQCLSDLGQVDEATELLQEILEKHPKDRPTRSLLRKLQRPK